MRTEEKYGMADIHIHSSASDGLADIHKILEYVQMETDLDVIAITDHDTIEGGYQARELAEKGEYRFEVIVGMEITTREGHLLALFLERPVPSLQPVTKTIEAIHAQGGLCIAPHPMSWLTHSIGQRTLDRLVNTPEEGIYLDGIEMVNSTIAGRISYQKVKQLNQKRYHLAEVGGSDAHFLAQIGCSYTVFQGRGVADLRRCLIDKTTQAGNKAAVGLGKIGYSQVARQLIRGLVVWPTRLYTRLLLTFLQRLQHEDRTDFSL